MARINLWSSPRNISTALMYAFDKHKDFTVVDEPLYAYYLNLNPAQQKRHPGAKAIMDSQSIDGIKVMDDLLNRTLETNHLLAKQMTHHLDQFDLERLLPFQNILLIRPPERIIYSYQKVISTPCMKDIGIAEQLTLFNFFKDQNKPVVVLDTHELLKNPKKVLKILFKKLNLDFDESMLQWNAGPKKADGVWAKYWYANAHKSTSFKKLENKEIQLSEDMIPLLESCNQIYNTLFEHAIKA
jgi:hypothetical protein